MAAREINSLTRALREQCRAEPLAEKRLLAPSLRVGYQWLDQVARSGQPALNLRVTTLPGLALELASREMERQGVSFLRGMAAEVLVDRLLTRLGQAGRGYLSGLNPSPGLTATVWRALRDLRLAGLCGEGLPARVFEVEAKGRELRALLAEYEKELGAKKLADYADVLRIAAAELRKEQSLLPAGSRVLLPEDMEQDLAGRESALWQAIPPASRVLLQVDRPEETPEGLLTDFKLLRWIARPTEAPAPKGDRTAEIFRATGEVNEVREVWRRCVEEKIAWDEVEIIHTDAATYVPLLYELGFRLKSEAEEGIPVTFAEGIPTRYSRPARALLGWVAWVREDYLQSFLVRMIQDGLLKLPGVEEKELSFTRLAQMLRAVPIGQGRERYLAGLDQALAGLEQAARRKSREDDERMTGQPLAQRREGLRAIRSMVEELLALLPADRSDQKNILAAAAAFLEKHARRVNQFDEYSHGRLRQDIGELREAMGDGEPLGLSVWEWLQGLPQSAPVAGQGPRPGCLFVSGIQSGGHSGRRHTFIIGLDDSRFPGAGLQDPLLLDHERRQLSAELPTAQGRLEKSLENFGRLLMRLRGSVTLGYCCRDLSDDRELFPSPVVLNAFRILSGQREGTQEDLLKWLAAPASFAPNADSRCLDSSEWWLWRLCGGEAIRDAEAVLARHFPHLGRGLRAREARESDRFTEYDGYVPEAGHDLDPTRPAGPVLSASRLETLGRCPLEYFFRYVLKIKPPEEYQLDPNAWLNHLERGELLHRVFRAFMSRLNEQGRLPEFQRDQGLLQDILEQEIAAEEAEKPPANPAIFEYEKERLSRVARIFLQEEDKYCRTRRPLYFEAAIGMEPEGGGTPLDTPEPVPIRLPGGQVVRVRGKIDRVDEIPGSRGKRLAVWDYKTGSSRDYDPNDPFRQGRQVQSALYLALAEARLQKLDPGALVTEFGYFFPGLREHGERLQWTKDQLAAGARILENLVRMLSQGCFPFTDKADDIKFSDYRPAFGEVERLAEAAKSKLKNPGNPALAPFRELREYDEEESDE